MDENLVSMHFPKAGIDLQNAFWDQQPRNIGPGRSDYARSTVSGINVRGFEAVSQRNRGGSRPGLTRYISTRPGNVLWVTQELALLVGDYNPPGGGMQTSQSGRVVTVVVVTQGQIYVANAGDTVWTAATNSTGEDPPLNYTGLVYSASNLQKLWMVDGTNYVTYDPNINTATLWTVGTYQPGDTGGVAGSAMGAMPVDSDGNYARLICLWRGRIVLAGLLLDPQNWFMSAIADPTNWDYAPLSITPSQAIAGNNAPQGLIGDVITSLCPYTDDILVVFGDHTIYMMRGDPMDGGQIDLISDAIGGAWGICWCKDPFGTIYFVSNKTGIFTLVPGQAPQRISQQIDSLIFDVDTGANTIRLAWDDRYLGLHVFITPTDAPAAATHYFYEQRTGAWWQDKFSNNNHNPLCCCVFDGNLATDRRVLLGSWDGYVRTLDPAASNDDGYPIESSVVIGPLLTENQDDMLLKDIQGVLGQASGDVDYEVFVGPTAEAALASEAVLSGTWKVSTELGGRNLTNFIRRSGHAVYVKLSASVPWAMESVKTRIATQGKVRRRGK